MADKDNYKDNAKDNYIAENENYVVENEALVPPVKEPGRVDPGRVDPGRVYSDRVNLDSVDLNRVNLDSVNLDSVNSDKVNLSRVNPDRINSNKANPNIVRIESIFIYLIFFCAIFLLIIIMKSQVTYPHDKSDIIRSRIKDQLSAQLIDINYVDFELVKTLDNNISIYRSSEAIFYDGQYVNYWMITKQIFYYLSCNNRFYDKTYFMPED